MLRRKKSVIVLVWAFGLASRAGAEGSLFEAGCAMKRALYRVSMVGMLGVALSAVHPVYAADADNSMDTAPSLCLDGMETAPIEDELAPTEISVDGGCMVPQTPISI